MLFMSFVMLNFNLLTSSCSFSGCAVSKVACIYLLSLAAGMCYGQWVGSGRNAAAALLVFGINSCIGLKKGGKQEAPPS